MLKIQKSTKSTIKITPDLCHLELVANVNLSVYFLPAFFLYGIYSFLKQMGLGSSKNL